MDEPVVTEASNPAPDSDIRDAISQVGTSALSRLESIASTMSLRIRRQVPSYGSGRHVSQDELRRSCRAHARFVLSALGGPEPSELLSAPETLPGTTGRRGAELGLPLADVMSAYRLGLNQLWDEVAMEAVRLALPPAAIIELTSRVWSLHESFVQEVVVEYREIVAERALVAEEEASAMLASVLEGRVGDRDTLIAIANLLSLPSIGPFVVVVAEVDLPGRHAITGVRERLTGLGLPSAWRLLPDGQLGIVRVGADGLDRLTGFLRSVVTRRAGVSPLYDDLAGTAAAVRQARLALRSCPPPTGVGVYDENPLGVVSVAAPEVMGRFVEDVLGGLDDLPTEERALLLSTLRCWLSNSGSAQETAKVLFCHPNTVRHRLRRVEDRTGRSTTDPRELTELCLAVEAEQRLGSIGPGLIGLG